VHIKEGFFSYKLMHSQEICLRKRIFNLKDLGEVINRPMRTLQCKSSLVLQASCGVDANGNAFSLILALGHGFNVSKVTHGPGQKLPVVTYR
jgi:hypothetical protein